LSTILETLATAHAFHQRGEMPQAEALYRQVLAVEPSHGDACNALAVLALQTNRAAEAVELLERAVASEPDNLKFRGNLGSAYFTANRFEEARATLEQAIAGNPDNSEAHYNLGVTWAALKEFDKAEASYKRCLQLMPRHRESHNNLGNMLREQGRFDEAIVYLDQALQIDPSTAFAHFNRALAWLSQGRLTEGWREYEWRWKCQEFKARHQRYPQWDGRLLENQTLLVHAEQGLGDTIQFVRFLPEVRRRAPRTLVEVQAPLIGLLRQSGFTGLVAKDSALPPIDAQIAMASLPFTLGTKLETIPAEVPYLRANQELALAWRDYLLRYNGLKVGIAWQGNPGYREDHFRSFPLVSFAPLADVPGVQLFGLQKGPGREQIEVTKDRLRLVDLGAHIDVDTGPFLDTAAIMQNLDLVITSDTVTAHLAGALGVPVWVALRRGADWRWMAEGTTSPWYPTMRLFRQQVFGQWPPVFAEMASELRTLAEVAR
jgi:Tfp pilus assembly protein PilF